MRKNKKYLLLSLFSIICFMIGSIMLFQFNLCKVAKADEIPSYFSIAKYTKDINGEETIYTKVGDEISLDNTALLDDGQVIILKLCAPGVSNYNEFAMIYSSMQMYVNNKTITIDSSWIKQETTKSGDFDYVEIIIDPYINDSTSILNKEGRYDFSIEYKELSGENFSVDQIKELNFHFYAFKTSTYFTNSTPYVQFSNVETFSAGTASSYYRTHQFYFKNSTTNDVLNLPTLSYDTNKFQIRVSKQLAGINTESIIKLNNEGVLTQTNNIVKIFQQDNMATITFNDIGEYQIHYTLLHKTNNFTYILSDLTSATKYERLNIFGLQLYIQNAKTNNSDDKIEFKMFDEQNRLIKQYQTDITNSRMINEDNIVVKDENYIINVNELNEETIVCPTTNLPPVELVFNASIQTDSSYVYKLQTRDANNINLWSREKYYGNAISDVGTYLIKATYKSSLSYDPNKEYTQYFLFSINNQAPSFDILNENGEQLSSKYTNKSVLVKNNENNTNPFSAPTHLAVYSKGFAQPTYDLTTSYSIPAGESKVFDVDGDYLVKMEFGKNLKKSLSSNFTIDTSEISGVESRYVEKQYGQYQKQNQFNFFTDQPFFLQWNNKLASGNDIKCYYKYFPITVNNSQTFTTSELESYYTQQKSVPVKYQISYNPKTDTNITRIPYNNNNSNSNTITAENVLTRQGIYVFYLKDMAGNETYKSVVLDYTKPVVLQKIGQNFITDFSVLNIVAENTKIIWGKYKVIIFDQLDIENYRADSTWLSSKDDVKEIDPYLQFLLKNYATTHLLSNDNAFFKTISINGKNRLYLASKIDTENVQVQIGQNIYKVNEANYGGGQLIDEYSYQILVADEQGSIFENSYSFFIKDRSSVTNSYSTIHNIQVSTDMSKTSVRFSSDNAYQGLTQHNYKKTDQLTSEASIFYMPINYPLLELQYLTTPSQNSVELKSITLDYFPFITDYYIYTGNSAEVDIEKDMYYSLNEVVKYTKGDKTYKNENDEDISSGNYTIENLLKWNILSYANFQKGTSYVLSKTSTPIIIYDYETGVNLGTLKDNLYVYNLNTYYDPINNNYLTSQGKYVIRRQYRDLASTAQLVGNNYDFMKREITFFVDRQKLISSPIMIDTSVDPNETNENFISRVGGNIFIRMHDSNTYSLDFKDLYRAYNYQTIDKFDILTTNKLPVKLYLPMYKFGEMINSKFTTYSNLLFYDNAAESYINAFEMSATITNLISGQKIQTNYSFTIEDNEPVSSNTLFIKLDNGKYLHLNGVNNNGYLKLASFNKIGQYSIELKQNDSSIKGNKNSITFFVRIDSQAPDFNIQNNKGNSVTSNATKTTYYSNQDELLLTWTDSTNDYMAKIDKSDITYTIDNIPFSIKEDDIVTENYKNSVLINLESAVEGSILTITMHYEGLASDYPSSSYSVTKTVIIDKIAPTQSLNNLFSKASEPQLINASNLREGHNESLKYNRSTTNTDNIFYNFAFAVDKSNFDSLIFNSTDKTSLYYRKITNKYDGSYKELALNSPDDIAEAFTIVTTGTQYTKYIMANDVNNLLTAKSYYEIVEIDLAGNITVYSIYLTDSDNEDTKIKNEKVIDYTANGEQMQYDYNNILNNNYSILLKAKNNLIINNFNLFDYPWTIITYADCKYIFSPDLKSTVYKYDSLGAISEVKLSDELSFGVNKFNYVLNINNLPKNNISLHLAVTNINISHTLPEKENESIMIQPIQATSSTTLNWESIKIWEIDSLGTKMWVEYDSEHIEPINYSNAEAFNLVEMTKNSQNQTTFKIKAPKNGAYYQYIINDNFHSQTVINHLYGEEFIKEIINYDGNQQILKDIIDDVEYYLSNKDFAYNYYSSITKIEVAVQLYDKQLGIYTNVGIYDSKNPSTLTTALVPYLSVNTFANSSYTQIKMKAVANNAVKYILTSNSTISNIGENESQEFNFLIYNITPTINLKGKNGQNLNGLLDNSINMTSEPVTFEYSETSGFAYPVEVFVQFENEEERLTPTKTTFNRAGMYKIILRYTGLMNSFDIASLRFQISDASWQFYTVVQYDSLQKKYVEVEKTDLPYTLSNNTDTINAHFIVNTLDYKILVNESQGITNPIEESNSPDKKAGNVETKIYTISNHSSLEENINFFESKVAITYIEKSDKIIDRFYYIDATGNEKMLNYSEATYSVTKELETADSVIVSWSSYYKIVENLINVEIRYGETNKLVSNDLVTKKNGISSITLNRSGLYYFAFSDIAGNVHKFSIINQTTTYTGAFEFTYLKDVVFTINQEAPINYAIYNNDVTIQIPAYTLSFYDSNARPKINALKNGEIYDGYIKSTRTRTYTFSEPGLYEITFSAKKNESDLREEKYYFQIIKENELFWAYDIERYENYYIDKIVKNNLDITDELSNANIGELTYIPYINSETNETIIKPRLRNLLISIYDEKTGAGNYEITVATQNVLSQTFKFKIKLTTATVPISISQEEGKSTDKVVTVDFNAYNLYSEIGDCVIKVAYYDDIVLNEDYFTDESVEAYSLKIEEAGTFYVQILSASGKLIYSYKIVKAEPLNAIAWILIVVGIAVVLGLTIMFILLRKKMKIR